MVRESLTLRLACARRQPLPFGVPSGRGEEGVRRLRMLASHRPRGDGRSQQKHNVVIEADIFALRTSCERSVQRSRHPHQQFAARLHVLGRSRGFWNRIAGRPSSLDPCIDRVVKFGECFRFGLAERRRTRQVGCGRDEAPVFIAPEHICRITLHGVTHRRSLRRRRIYRSSRSAASPDMPGSFVPFRSAWKFRPTGSPERWKARCRPFPPLRSKPSQPATLQASSNRTSFGLLRIAANSFSRLLTV